MFAGKVHHLRHLGLGHLVSINAALADPMLVAAGIQVIRAIGIKKLIPILAVGGLALGLLASRNSSTADEAPAE